jgi:hypothetical protein
VPGVYEVPNMALLIVPGAYEVPNLVLFIVPGPYEVPNLVLLIVLYTDMTIKYTFTGGLHYGNLL